MKTIEETANEFAIRYAPVLLEEQCRSYFKAGDEFAQRWIPVEEELPEPKVSIMLKNSVGLYGIGEFQNKKWLFYTIEGAARFKKNITNQVTHWRPIELK